MKRTRPPRNQEPKGMASKIPALHLNRVVFLIVVVLCSFILVYAFHSRVPIAAGAYRGYNVVLITIDTLRADHLPVYGYKKIRTPNIEQLGSESLVFESAYSHAPLTLPAHTSILTGQLPSATGVRDNAGFVLDRKIKTIAEVFKQHGYSTAAFVSSFVLDSTWQLDRGFDVYFDQFTRLSDEERRASITELEAEHWLERNRQTPFFLWIHFYDPHEPYEPPEPFKSEYRSHPYDGEIAYTDLVLGRFLQRLKEAGTYDRTLIVLTGDHGESFGEHGETGHGLFLYNTTQHVPLLIRLPKGKHRTITQAVSHIDIAPTLLQWLGVKPLPSAQGASLIPLIQGKERGERAIYSQSDYAELHYGWSNLKSVTRGRYKYIQAPRPELYDLQSDPWELRNLHRSNPGIAAELTRRLKDTMDRASSSGNTAATRMDPDLAERFNALGYITNVSAGSGTGSKIDPKDKIETHQMYQDAVTAISRKQYGFALERLAQLIAKEPKMPDAYFSAGVAYAATGQMGKAIDSYLKAIQLRPGQTMPYFNLATAYEATGNLNEAERWFTKVLETVPDQRFAMMRLASIYRAEGQDDRAREFLKRAVEWHENALSQAFDADSRSNLFSILSQLYFESGDLRNAKQNLDHAIELTPQRSTLHYNLGVIYEALGSMNKAADEYKKELELQEPHPDAFLNLGILYAKANRKTEAALCFENALRRNPNDNRAVYLLAHVKEEK